MTLDMQTFEVDGTTVIAHLDPGKPLLLTMRMAPLDMNLWERIWPLLAQDFSVASFNLPPPDPAEYPDYRDMYRRLGQRVVDVARALGHERFHYLGWTGGAELGLHMLVDQPEHLLSAVLFGAIVCDHEQRDRDRFMEILEALLGAENGLELYSWWWLQYSFTPEWLHDHYDEAEAMVARRLEADRIRKLDAPRALRWIQAMVAPEISDSDLAEVRVPTLIVGAPFDQHIARRVQRRIPSSQLAFVNAGPFAPYERPDLFLAAIRPFHRAALAERRAGHNGQVTAPLHELRRGGDRVVWAEPPARTGVLLLHGWLMAPDMWSRQVAALQERGIRAVAVAQPGHAGSAGVPDDYDMNRWADDTVAFATAVGLDRMVVAGHSMGGMLALAMAARHPERIAGICLVGTTDEAWEASDQDEFLNLVGAVSAGWGAELAGTVGPLLLGEEFLKRTPAFLGAWTNQVQQYELAAMTGLGRAIAHRPDRTADSARLDVPAVVIHGNDDDAVDHAYGVRLAGRTPGARLITLDGVGHCPPLEAPDAVAAAIVELAEQALHGAPRSEAAAVPS